jgi:CBS domain-containing protein
VKAFTNAIFRPLKIDIAPRIAFTYRVAATHRSPLFDSHGDQLLACGDSPADTTRAHDMKLYEILSQKGQEVYSIAPEATLAEMAEKLVSHNCGSLVVLEADRMIGIITERDLIKSYVSTRRGLAELRVADFMSRDVVTGLPTDDVSDTMGLLTQKRIRHLPILDDQQLVGMISIGDLVKAQHDELSVENHFMKSYIQS